MTPLRSVLYVPGSNERALEKAADLPVDAIIFDLEDAVATEAKVAARTRVCQLLAETDFGPRQRIIRINDPDTSLGEEDFFAALEAQPDAVLLPKVENAEDLARHLMRIDELGQGEALAELQLWAMIETPMAILNIAQLADLAAMDPPRLTTFVLGTNDLVKETGVQPGADRALLQPWLMSCVLAARAYGLAIIDGVHNDFSDMDGFAAACRQGRAMGMDGKTLIHPAQIAPCNEIFAPSEQELSAAREIVEAFEGERGAGLNVLSINGRMVERLHFEQAKALLARASQIAARRGA